MTYRSLRLGVVVSALLALTAGVALGGPAGAAQPGSADLNQPSYYESLGYGTCTKTENPGDPYVLPAAPAGAYWTLLVLKAGSAESNDDWNTLVPNPVPGPYVHPSGKDLSHVITCTKPGTPPSTTTTTATTVPGGPCDEYTPTQVAVDPMTVLAGGAITITGVAYPGDNVTATLTPPGTVLGTAVAGPTGQFSISGIIPVGTKSGTYTITVASQGCPTQTSVTITVVGSVFSGCGANNDGRTFPQGASVSWALHVPSFNTGAPVTLRMTRSGYTNVLYSGPWPPSNDVNVTIPLTAPTGKYTMEQIGTKANGKGSLSKTCPVWVVLKTATVASSLPSAGPGGGSDDATRQAIVIGAVAVGGFALVRGGGRRARLRPARR